MRTKMWHAHHQSAQTGVLTFDRNQNQMVNTLGLQQAAQFRLNLVGQQGANLTFPQDVSAHAAVNIHRLPCLQEFVGKAMARRQDQVVAVQRAKPGSLGSGDLRQLFKDGGKGRFELFGVCALPGHRVENIESLYLYARVIQHDHHHADTQQEIHYDVEGYEALGIGMQIKMQEEQRDGQEPSPQIPASPGKADQFHHGRQQHYAPGEEVEYPQ